MISLTSLVEFTKKYRNNTKAFLGWNDTEIANEIVEAMKSNSAVVVKDEHDNISGLVIGTPDNIHRNVHIKAILTKPDSKNNLRCMLKVFYDKFPGYTLSGIRRQGTIRNYSDKTTRLCKLLELRAN